MTAVLRLYTFETADGTEQTYSTQYWPDAEAHGMTYGLRVIENTYEWQGSDLAADYTGLDTPAAACIRCGYTLDEHFDIQSPDGRWCNQDPEDGSHFEPVNRKVID